MALGRRLVIGSAILGAIFAASAGPVHSEPPAKKPVQVAAAASTQQVKHTVPVYDIRDRGGRTAFLAASSATAKKQGVVVLVLNTEKDNRQSQALIQETKDSMEILRKLGYENIGIILGNVSDKVLAENDYGNLGGDNTLIVYSSGVPAYDQPDPLSDLSTAGSRLRTYVRENYDEDIGAPDGVKPMDKLLARSDPAPE